VVKVSLSPGVTFRFSGGSDRSGAVVHRGL